MKHATNCKFCKKPITIEIDDEYSKLGDPLKIIGLAACNRCADLRVEKRNLEAKIRFTCMMRAASLKKPSETQDQKARGVLESLTKKYANMIARWHHKDGMAWDEECVNLLMEKPAQWGIIIGELWKLYNDWEKHGFKA